MDFLNVWYIGDWFLQLINTFVDSNHEQCLHLFNLNNFLSSSLWFLISTLCHKFLHLGGTQYILLNFQLNGKLDLIYLVVCSFFTCNLLLLHSSLKFPLTLTYHSIWVYLCPYVKCAYVYICLNKQIYFSKIQRVIWNPILFLFGTSWSNYKWQ